MPDREKVMQWLETCVSGCEEGCPYEYKNLVYRVECKADLMRDALALLKEQEPKHVKVVKNAYNHEFYYCPRCDRSFYELSFGKPKFCDKCGQEVKWE